MDREGLRQPILSGAYASFLIRLWCEPSGEQSEPGAGWRAEVEHIQSSKRWAFGDIGQALDFLRQQAEGRRPSEQEPVTPAEAGSINTRDEGK